MNVTEVADDVGRALGVKVEGKGLLFLVMSVRLGGIAVGLGGGIEFVGVMGGDVGRMMMGGWFIG
ncbi:iron chelate uptake ABC transporter family permease subunit, partial [Bacillus altitudinis]|uniref:iron chelate uptake ABC transporter family permease subunit n=1 Tax=Bacillus altitudinis TaxID=293387 RepID=UPI001F2CA132